MAPQITASQLVSAPDESSPDSLTVPAAQATQALLLTYSLAPQITAVDAVDEESSQPTINKLIAINILIVFCISFLIVIRYLLFCINLDVFIIPLNPWSKLISIKYFPKGSKKQYF